MKGRLYTVGTSRLTLYQIAVSSCVSTNTLRTRLLRGMDPERAATMPTLSYSQAAKRARRRWCLDRL